MIEYQIVVQESCAGLMKDVREFIAESWRPLGGVVVGYRDELIKQEPMDTAGPRAWRLPQTKRRMYWVQTMIREGEQK